MVDHTTLGVLTTGTGARITTSLIDAGKLNGTVRIDGTLGATMRWSTKVVGLASTDGLVLLVAAGGIETTRRGYAGIAIGFSLWWRWC